ncbi:hypothetical protein [Cupriavidus basilensis]|nr:hypothetical protein [Cupriavidus basilensis]
MLTHPGAYQAFGQTAHGSSRYRCKSCQKTFSVPGPTTGQKKPHLNRDIFLELVNKAPFRRILEKQDIKAPTLYQKIDFLVRQCERFLANRERKLMEGLPLGHLSVSVDRQDYYTNWTRRQDKRNVPLHAVVAAENRSGYVFGTHVNFDARFQPDAVEADVRTDDDDLKPQEHRRNARFWLASEYSASVLASGARKRYRNEGDVLGAASATYANAAQRDDIEVPDDFVGSQRLPETGMQVHSEYTLYAHFQILKRLLTGADAVTFYLDQDSGIRAACLAAFAEDVQRDRVHAFFVKTNKDMTKGEKVRAFNGAKKTFRDAQARMPGLSDYRVKVELIKEQLPLMKEIGRYHDRWLIHPLPTMNEPEKALCHLTERPGTSLTTDALAELYLYGSTYGADRFLELVRRRLSPLERALGSASAARRMWYGYAPYNPAMIEKLLVLLRTYWNYCLVPDESRDGKTPAMRLGLARAPVRLEDIIYFDPLKHSRGPTKKESIPEGKDSSESA